MEQASEVNDPLKKKPHTKKTQLNKATKCEPDKNFNYF